jgi:hypothetical protein
VNIINVIAPYKSKDAWVFDDPRVGLIQEHFISGADALINHAVENIPDADRGFFLIFSGHPFPGYLIGLNWRRSDMDGNWYYSERLGQEVWLRAALLKYFDVIPKALYLQCKAKPQTAKHPSDWTARGEGDTAEGHTDDPVPALIVRPHDADAQHGIRPSEDLVLAPSLSHSHAVGDRAWLRNAAVLILFLIVIGNLVLVTIGFVGGSRPHKYFYLFMLWVMGIIGIVMLARLWRAVVRQRMSLPSEPTS